MNKKTARNQKVINIPEKQPFRFTIRVGILTFFMTTFLSFSIAMLGVISYSFYNNSVTLTRQIVEAISNSVLREVSTQLNPTHSASRLSAKLVEANTLDVNSVEQLISYTLNTLLILPQAQMAYFGDESGNFVIARREPDGTLSSEIIDYRSEKPKREYLYRDAEGNISIRKPIASFDYDPRKRPWYQLAQKQSKTVWTPAYLFYSGKEKTLGITSATPALKEGKLIGVFGIDVKLASISRFLSKQKVSENGLPFIINREGKVIASPNDIQELKHVDEVEQPGLAKAFHYANKMNGETIQYSVDDVTFYAKTYDVPGFEMDGWRIYIVLPEEDVTGPVKEANKQTLLICLFLLFVGVILISIFAKRIAVPINKLAKDIERVKLFNIKTKDKLDSRIQEVYEMSSAIHSMKIGLQSFQKYVPQQLVRKLISSGEAAKIGGRSRRITLMFSDIDDFTAIAESTKDEEIMVQMCEYFDIFDENIQETKGTVDKFIGDAIMAFWGAPERDDLQTFHACSTAVNCQRAIAHQNHRWAEENKMPFPTRIGIHTGNVIIGNLGSMTRLNYTAIGDAVNITSRLENLNKIYKTRTIVSADAYEKVKEQFLFRKLDEVIVKGRVQSIGIYELLDFKNIETEREYTSLIELSENALALYRQGDFKNALKAFKRVLNEHKNDGPAKLFIERCEYFIENPDIVEKDWSGIWRYTHK